MNTKISFSEAFIQYLGNELSTVENANRILMEERAKRPSLEESDDLLHLWDLVRATNSQRRIDILKLLDYLGVKQIKVGQ